MFSVNNFIDYSIVQLEVYVAHLYEVKLTAHHLAMIHHPNQTFKGAFSPGVQGRRFKEKAVDLNANRAAIPSQVAWLGFASSKHRIE